MTTSYPVRFAPQLKQHLRALRKKRRLTQARLGALIGVSQARIAEIEANPGLVSFDQMLQLLSALGVTLALQEDSVATVQDRPSEVKRAVRNKPGKAGASGIYKFTQTAEGAHPNPGADFSYNTPIWNWTMFPLRQGGPASPVTSEDKEAQSAPRHNFVIRPKKGAW